MRSDLARLSDVRFILALAMLALNDHLLKHTWPCWFTGKLSDVVGLFAFGWFWVALIPHRRTAVLIAIAVLFAWWKSPLSQTAMDAWNDVGPWTIGRVVDASDLLALPVLLLVRRAPVALVVPGRVVRFASGVLALLVFGATSIHRSALMPLDITTLQYEDIDYKLRTSEADFWRVLDTLAVARPLDTVRISTVGSDAKHYCLNNVRLREVGAHSVRFSYHPVRGKLRFHLLSIDPDHPIRIFSGEELDAYRDLYRRLFEQAVLKSVDRSAVPSGRHVRYTPFE